MPAFITPLDLSAVPSIIQPVTAPVTLLRQTMSLLPSPSRSAIATVFHSAVTGVTPVIGESDTIVRPFIIHARISPAAVRQRMSPRPSPSRSATPA